MDVRPLDLALHSPSMDAVIADNDPDAPFTARTCAHHWKLHGNDALLFERDSTAERARLRGSQAVIEQQHIQAAIGGAPLAFVAEPPIVNTPRGPIT